MRQEMCSMIEFLPLADQCCRNCRYSRGSKEGGYLFCQRNPPALTPFDNISLNQWPGVSPREWCGEWTPGPQCDRQLLEQAQDQLEIFGLHEHLGDFDLSAVREVLKRYGSHH